MMEVVTPRLLLVSLDAGLMRVALADRHKLISILGVTIPDDWPNPEYAEALPFIAADLEADPAKAGWDGLIVRRSDNVVVGDLGLKGGPNAEHTAELGFGIVAQYRGMGYATEMVGATVAWAFETAAVERIVAECSKDNRGSIRVLEKLGIRQFGSSDDMLLWDVNRPR